MLAELLVRNWMRGTPLFVESGAWPTNEIEVLASKRELIFHLRVPRVCPGLANVGPGPKPRTFSSQKLFRVGRSRSQGNPFCCADVAYHDPGVKALRGYNARA